jgi:hypothetical protein
MEEPIACRRTHSADNRDRRVAAVVANSIVRGGDAEQPSDMLSPGHILLMVSRSM